MLIGIDANEANLTTHRVGINQYAFNLLHALYMLPTRHNYVIYLKNPPLSDLPKSRSNWNYRIIPFPKAWTQTRLPWDLFIHHPRPDVFLSLTHYGPRWSPIPFVVSVMDLGFLQFPNQFTPRDYTQLKNWTGYSIKKAAHILAISQNTKKDIQKYFGIDSFKITVTYLAHDSRHFVPTENRSVLKKYHITKPYFLFLSSMKPSKNIEGLIRAFDEFKNNNHNEMQLVIAGKKAWMYEQIDSLVKDLHLQESVLFTGFVDDTDVPALMTQAFAFIMPSFYEGFGLPVLEAFACGTPVIVSNIASLPEVAGDAAVYVDPYSHDSLVWGLKQITQQNRAAFVKKGLERVKLFSWEKCARATLKTLENVI